MEFLPYVMLGRRVAVQQDIQSSPTDLVFGGAVKIPGEIINPGPEFKSIQDLLKQIGPKTSQPAKEMSRHRSVQEHFPENIHESTHVYIKVQGGHSLQPKFFGPCLVVDRPSRSTITVKTGTYRNGKDKLETHHWQNARPAFVGPNTKVAERPTLGRPPTSGLADPPTETEVVAWEIPVPPPAVEQNRFDDQPDYQPPQFPVVENQNNDTETLPVDDAPNFESENDTPAESTQRPVRSTRNIPHPKFQDYSMWSATKYDLQALNHSINHRVR